VPAEAFKEVPPEGDVIAGHRLPAGTWVGWNLRSMFRRKDLWGDDAELFRPERWLEAAAADKDGDGERFRYLAGLIDMAFGSGRFQCPGKLLAWTMLGKTIVEVSLFFFSSWTSLIPLYLWFLILIPIIEREWANFSPIIPPKTQFQTR